MLTVCVYMFSMENIAGLWPIAIADGGQYTLYLLQTLAHMMHVREKYSWGTNENSNYYFEVIGNDYSYIYPIPTKYGNAEIGSAF